MKKFNRSTQQHGWTYTGLAVQTFRTCDFFWFTDPRIKIFLPPGLLSNVALSVKVPVSFIRELLQMCLFMLT